MRALVCRRYGPPENLEVAELPEPVPGPGEVLVDVRAAAVNFPDVLLVANTYQVPVPLPFVPGSELAGEVLAVGDGVQGIREGDRVFGTTLTAGGDDDGIRHGRLPGVRKILSA